MRIRRVSRKQLKADEVYRSKIFSLVSSCGLDPESLDECSQIFVAEFSDMIGVAGVAGLTCYRGNWCLRCCSVKPNCRGFGIQILLIRARLNYLRRIGAHWADVWVRPENVSSMNNLVSCGFRFVDEKPRLFHNKLHLKLRKIVDDQA